MKLLIEIGVEELPAIPFLKIVKEIENSWKNILVKNRVTSDFNFFYTPRRLVLKHSYIDNEQKEYIEELFGPQLSIAIKNEKISPAGLGFSKKCKVDFKDLDKIIKNGKEVLYFKKKIKGKEISLILEEMIKEWILSMNFRKMMKWGSRKDEFIRPIRWINIISNNKNININIELFGLKSKNITYIHRTLDFYPIKIKSIEDYEKVLLNGKVILSQKDRKDKVEQEFYSLEAKNNFSIDKDKNLINEIIAITENPTSLIGEFNSIFLELPEEVIITSMKKHQKYFPIFQDKKIINKFIIVSNSISDNFEKVIKGNEKVLKARLSDALFFYKNDLKNKLNIKGLEDITFMNGLGSLADKVIREKRISKILIQENINSLKEETKESENNLYNLIDEAISLCKADLLTEMVYEFTELQGVMGYYYASALNKNTLICSSIKEQYYPLQDGSELPNSIFSSIIAISIKLDSIISLFSIDKIPTGSKDPFSLRRAVNSIIRISIKYNLTLNLDKLLNPLKPFYKKIEINKIYNFFIERIYKILDINPSIIQAVINSSERDIIEIIKKAKALNEISSQDNFRENFSTFKRVANISKDVNSTDIDIKLFEKEIENILYYEYKCILSKNYIQYKDKLESLFGLKNTLNKYFDEVMINTENKVIRKNRQNLIYSIYLKFKDIADIKYISL